MLVLFYTALAFAYSPHCEIDGRYAAAKAPTTLEVYGVPGKPPKKIASGRTGPNGGFHLRFWQSKTDSYEGFFVRAVDKNGKKLADSPEVKFSIDPGDCSAKVEF